MLLELIKVACLQGKNTKSFVFLNTSNEHMDIKIKNTVPFAIAKNK